MRAQIEAHRARYERETQPATVRAKLDRYRSAIARNEDIRRLKVAGVPDAEIARLFSIGITTVAKIHVGRTA